MKFNSSMMLIMMANQIKVKKNLLFLCPLHVKNNKKFCINKYYKNKNFFIIFITILGLVYYINRF